MRAPSQAKPHELLPWLVAANHGGFTSLAVHMQAPTMPLVTKTLGTLHKERCCSRLVTLADSAAPLSRFATWGDLAHATHGSPLSVSLR